MYYIEGYFCMIDKNTLRINFRSFFVGLFLFCMLTCNYCERLCACAASSARTYLAGLIDADSGPLESERPQYF